jgi:hypothetical protein
VKPGGVASRNLGTGGRHSGDGVGYGVGGVEQMGGEEEQTQEARGGGLMETFPVAAGD